MAAKVGSSSSTPTLITIPGVQDQHHPTTACRSPMPTGRAPSHWAPCRAAQQKSPRQLPCLTRPRCGRHLDHAAAPAHARHPARTDTTPACTMQMPNKSQLYRGFKHKQEEWANMQQQPGKPVAMVELKPPKPQPQKRQPTPSHKITSSYLPSSTWSWVSCWMPYGLQAGVTSKDAPRQP